MHLVTMPQAGNTMEEGTVLRWLKAEGDAVAAGDVLLEVETDKATVEVEAEQEGTLRKILVPEDKTVPIKTPIAVLAAPHEDIAKAVAEAEKEVQAALGGAAPQPAKASPEPAKADKKPAAELKGQVTPILMPQPGQSVEEAAIVKWHVQPGDRIAVDQVIFEVETDKATIEVEAVDAGRLARIVVPEEQIVPVKTPVAYLAEDDADVDAYLAAQGEALPVAEPVEAEAKPAAAAPAPAEPSRPAATAEGRIKASPAARRIAGERGVDLASVGSGRGPGGRILSTDVEQAEAAPKAAPAAKPAAAPGEVIQYKLAGMRRAIARNLVRSKAPIPHFYMRLTIDAGPAYAFYKGEKANYPCSFNDVVTLACSRAMMEFPAFRSRVDGEEITQLPGANIGIAVGMDEGLVVPVLVGADRLALKGVAAETRRLVEAARGGKVEGMGQGTFTISNLGMFGVEEFSAIINPPEAAILAVGALREEAIVEHGAIRPGRVMTMTLSSDHRVIDGLLAAKFLARLKALLELETPLA